MCCFNHVHPFLDDGELIDKSQSIQRHYKMLEYLVDGSTVNIVKKQGVYSPRKRKPPVHLFLHHDSLSAQGLNGTGHEKGSDGK